MDATAYKAPARVALAAGGTGGHVMPALALAEALRDESPGIELLFLSGQREQEMAWYREAGVDPVALPAAPLGRGVARKARGLWGAWKSYRQAYGTLRRWAPHCVVGLGGYVSGPCVVAAVRLGVPTVIHEQNAIAGKTNRWLARWATAVATTFPEAFAGVSGIQAIVTGNPIRKALLADVPKTQALEHFRLDSDLPTLLVSGGSQGAQRLNAAMLGLLTRCRPGAPLRWQAIWLTGTRNYEEIKRRLEQSPAAPQVRLLAFLPKMGLAYAAADAFFCRAGSASLAEAAAWGLPMIVVPYPYAADDHQQRNARFYAEAGACRVLDETVLDPDQLASAVDLVLGDAEERRRMSEAARSLARPEAARNLARLILGTVDKAGMSRVRKNPFGHESSC